MPGGRPHSTPGGPGRSPGRPGLPRERRPPAQSADPPTEADPAARPAAPAPASARFPSGATHRVIALIAVVAVLALSYASSLSVYWSQQRDIATAQAQIIEHGAAIERMQDQLARWDDPDFVRAQARERLGWVMPGEVGYRVIGADGELWGGAADPIADQVATDQGPWFERLWATVKAADLPLPEAPVDQLPEPPSTVTVDDEPPR
ncbi:MAG: septum formation initiator family protein [Propionibacteriaceae bacterium]|jgi:cell division protein FtsB|nr:septum formation initiator family protein [Propionibacteriaceae bacterium]